MNARFDQVLARGGHSGALIASRDWSKHTLGPIDNWPGPLKNALSICLVSKTPILVWWGADPANLVEFYNDAYRPVLGSRQHMGARAADMWPLHNVLSAGQASDHRDSFMILERNGFAEETYFDHAHSPLYTDDGQIAGVFSTVQETTTRVLSERRLRTLKTLAEQAAAARDVASVYREGASLLYNNAADIPYCLVYGAHDRSYELLGCAGVDADFARAAHARLPLTQVLAAGRPLLAGNPVEPQVPEPAHHPGRKPPQQAYLLPIRSHPEAPPHALLVAGISPHLSFDATYRDFLELASTQLGAAIANASHAPVRRASEQIELQRALESMSGEREQLLFQEQAARAAAEAASRVKDEFLAVLGHELRNPLAPITTALALMRQKAPLDHEAVIIERQVGHLSRLVADLLDVSRITRGKVELKRRPLNMALVVREAIELASPLLEERQQHLSVEMLATGLDVLGDRTRLAQVLANLLTNASKYSERATHIIVRGRHVPETGMVEISVRDHGIGIDPEMLPGIWNAFTQGAQAIDRSHGGLGLGLTIVRSLVGLHGGVVVAHSGGRGQGSEFRVQLPQLGDERAQAPEPRMHSSQAHGGMFNGYKILLVDDNEDAVELLAEWFRTRGATVQTALDGLSALEVATRFVPDVALLDLGLPALNGYEVARRLRAQEAHRATLLIAVTGYGEQSARDETRAAGFDDHCVKPLDLSQFESRLRDRLAHFPGASGRSA